MAYDALSGKNLGSYLTPVSSEGSDTLVLRDEKGNPVWDKKH